MLAAWASEKQKKLKAENYKDWKRLSTNYTNECFAVNLILRHKIKLTARAPVLLVLPLCGMPFVDNACSVPWGLQLRTVQHVQVV